MGVWVIKGGVWQGLWGVAGAVWMAPLVLAGIARAALRRSYQADGPFGVDGAGR